MILSLNVLVLAAGKHRKFKKFEPLMFFLKKCCMKITVEFLHFCLTSIWQFDHRMPCKAEIFHVRKKFVILCLLAKFFELSFELIKK